MSWQKASPYVMLIAGQSAFATVLACEKDASNVLHDNASYEYDEALRLSAVRQGKTGDGSMSCKLDGRAEYKVLLFI